MKKILISVIIIVFCLVGILYFQKIKSQQGLSVKQYALHIDNSKYPNPIINSISPNTLKLNNSFTIIGSNFGEWIHYDKSAIPFGYPPIRVVLKDTKNQEQDLWAGYGNDLTKTSDSTNKIIVKIDKSPCVPASTTSGCAYGSDQLITPGKYFIYIIANGLESNAIPINILP